MTVACLEQLARHFGDEVRHSRATLIADWAAEPLTTTTGDLGDGGHPGMAEGAWVAGPWQARLFLAGSETSPTDPGLPGRRDRGRPEGGGHELPDLGGLGQNIRVDGGLMRTL